VIFVQRDFWEPLFSFLDNLVYLGLVNKNSYYSADNIDEIMDILLL
jgi:hypothetical protein